jgi:hypothetical protein
MPNKFGGPQHHKGGHVNYYDSMAPFIQGPLWWYPCKNGIPHSQTVFKFGDTNHSSHSAHTKMTHGSAKIQTVNAPDWYSPCVNGRPVGKNAKPDLKSNFGMFPSRLDPNPYTRHAKKHIKLYQNASIVMSLHSSMFQANTKDAEKALMLNDIQAYSRAYKLAQHNFSQFRKAHQKMIEHGKLAEEFQTKAREFCKDKIHIEF